MRARIETLLHISARTMWVGTFHGMAHRLLRMHWQEAGLPQNFQILDATTSCGWSSGSCVRWIWMSRSGPPPGHVVHQRAEGRGAARAKTCRQATICSQITTEGLRVYEELCKHGGLVDFAELLLRSHELWLKTPDCCPLPGPLPAPPGGRVSGHQHHPVRLAAACWPDDSATVMAVGDDDQSIYGWRGAEIENIHRYTKDFPDATTMRLEQNYRSTGNILKAANALIDYNSGRLGKELWTDGGRRRADSVYSGYNEQDEARFISRPTRMDQQEATPDEVAVLYRSNAQSRVLEEAHAAGRHPVSHLWRVRFFERCEIATRWPTCGWCIDRTDARVRARRQYAAARHR